MWQKKSLNIQNSDYTRNAQSNSKSESLARVADKSADRVADKSADRSADSSPSTSAWFEESEGGVKPPKNITQHKIDEKIILAAGCFWGVEARLRRLKGVIDTKVGYIGGTSKNPTYKQVCYENTEHAEACQVTFNTTETNLNELLKVFWQIHNPTEVDRQGADVGRQYRSAIFFCNDAQREIAKKSRELAQRQFASKIATEILKAPQFWLAEEYHQHYLHKKAGLI